MKGKKGFQKGHKHGFKKGKSGNPAGKKKGTVDFVTQLKDALIKYEETNGESFLENYIKRSKKNDSMATALMNKMLPNIQEITGKNGGAIEVKDARSKLFDRFNALANSRKKKASNK